jgi:hypothetical protein
MSDGQGAEGGAKFPFDAATEGAGENGTTCELKTAAKHARQARFTFQHTDKPFAPLNDKEQVELLNKWYGEYFLSTPHHPHTLPHLLFDRSSQGTAGESLDICLGVWSMNGLAKLFLWLSLVFIRWCSGGECCLVHVFSTGRSMRDSMRVTKFRFDQRFQMYDVDTLIEVRGKCNPSCRSCRIVQIHPVKVPNATNSTAGGG